MTKAIVLAAGALALGAAHLIAQPIPAGMKVGLATYLQMGYGGQKNDLTEAAEWARRTLTLDQSQPDAYAIVANAAARAGEAEAAAEAYRSYLKLAPNGWHASRARAALRER